MNAQTKHGCTSRPIIWQSRACLLIHRQSVYSAQTPWFNQRGIKGSGNHVYTIPSGIFYVINDHICSNATHYCRFTGLEAQERSRTHRYLAIRPSRRDSPSLHRSASLWRYRSPGLCKQTAWSCTSWGDHLLWELEKKRTALKFHCQEKQGRMPFYLKLKWESLRDEATFKKVRIPKWKKSLLYTFNANTGAFTPVYVCCFLSPYRNFISFHFFKFLLWCFSNSFF